MVNPLPAVQRYVNNVLDDSNELSFDLVVDSADGKFTYGGGRVTLRKPFTTQTMETTIDDSVEALILKGNEGLPRTRPNSKLLKGDPPRSVQLHVDRQNTTDRRPG